MVAAGPVSGGVAGIPVPLGLGLRLELGLGVGLAGDLDAAGAVTSEAAREADPAGAPAAACLAPKKPGGHPVCHPAIASAPAKRRMASGTAIAGLSNGLR